jgi:hypothetical protein
LALHEAAAGTGRSERRNVDTLIPLARPRESSSCLNVPCERRTYPAEPHRPQAPGASPGTLPPQNRCEHPGECGVPSERSGCAAHPGFHPGLVCGAPLGHSERRTTPRAPRAPRALSAITTTHRVSDDCFSSMATTKPSHRGTYPQPTQRQRDRAGASIGTSTSWFPSRDSAKAQPAPTFPASAGPIPRSPTAHKPQAPAPALCHCKTGVSTRENAAFLQNAPVVRHTRGFTPGWYAVPRWGIPNAAPPPEPPEPSVPSPQHTGSATIVFPQWRQSNHPH